MSPPTQPPTSESLREKQLPKPNSTDPKPRVQFHCPNNDAFYKSTIYQPLDPETQEIRLLEPIPSPDPNTPLSFTLRQPVPLSTCSTTHPFIALSYRAGNPFRTIPILIDNTPFSVFASLGLALHRLMSTSPSEGVYIWADQICINQSSPTEKASQVAMMSLIYASCTTSFAWLGPDPLVDKGLHHLQTFPNLFYMAEHLKYMQRKQNAALRSTTDKDRDPRTPMYGDANVLSGVSSLWLARKFLEKLESDSTDWSCVEALFKNEYFERGWIFQEMTISPDMSFYSDTAEMSRYWLDRCFRVLEMFRQAMRWNFDLEGQELIPKGATRALPKVVKLVPYVQKLVWLYKMDIERIKSVLERSEKWRKSRAKGVELYDLLDVIPVARNSKVTDPLDRVYAYLGVIPSEYGIVPDYGVHQTAEGLYVEATVRYMERHNSLNIASYALERSGDIGSRLPSWVVDWSVAQAEVSLQQRFMGDPMRPRASAGIGIGVVTAPGPNGEKDRVLRVGALVVDALKDVEKTVGRPVADYESWEHAIAAWLRIGGLDVEEGYSEVNDEEYGFVRRHSLAVAFWATMYRGVTDHTDARKMWRLQDPELQARGRAHMRRVVEEFDAMLEKETMEDGWEDEDEDEGGDSEDGDESDAEDDDEGEGEGEDEDGETRNDTGDGKQKLGQKRPQSGGRKEDSGRESGEEDDNNDDEDGKSDEGSNDTDDDGANGEEEPEIKVLERMFDEWELAREQEQDSGEEQEADKEFEESEDEEFDLIDDNGTGLSQHHLNMTSVMDRGYVTRAKWRFLRTPKGYFGLTRAEVQGDDVIMVLLGADIPFILRPYQDGYKIVGEVHLHGIMHGEIVRQNVDKDHTLQNIDNISIY